MPEPPQLVPLEAEEHSKSECSFTGKLRASSALWQTGLTIASLPRLQLLTVEKIKASNTVFFNLFLQNNFLDTW